MSQLQGQIFTALGIGRQSAFKTGVSPTAYIDNVLSVTGGLQQEKTQVKLTGSGHSSMHQDVVFKRWAEASFTGNLTVESPVLQTCLASVLGGKVANNSVSGDADEGYTHTFQIVGNETDGLDINRALTLIKYYGDSTAQQLIGCVLNSLKLTIPENGVITYEFGCFGYDSSDISISPTITPSFKPIATSLNATVEIGDLATFANLTTLPSYNSADIAFSNGLFQTWAGGYVDNMGMNPLEATITTSTPYDTAKTYLDYVKNNVRKSAVITVDTGVKVSDDASSKNYTIKFKFPEVSFSDSLNVDLNMDDTSEIRQSLTLTAGTCKEATNQYFMEIETVDGTSGTF